MLVIGAYKVARVMNGSCSIQYAMEIARSFGATFNDDDAYRWLLDLGSQ